jgi:hypothetical protein
MDQIHRLNEAEIAEALSGEPPHERIADCESCAAEFTAWRNLGEGLRGELESRADQPGYFWTRQQARIRERLAPRAETLRWAAAAICALVLFALALIHQKVAPSHEIAQTAPPAAVVAADPDDALLEDIQASLQREVPAPLAPAAVLVDEMASASNQVQQVKEN